MLAITVQPGAAGTVRLDEAPEPAPSEGALLVRARLLGVCGTDAEIVAGHYGAAPAALARADRHWLAGLITRRVPLQRFAEALVCRPDDIKVVIDFDG